MIPGLIYGQARKGKILSSHDNKGIPWVNVGIIGKNVGTVSDENGLFSLRIPEEYDSDSVRVSVIGYETKTFQVKKFRADSLRNVYLDPVSYSLPEISVRYHRPVRIQLGNPVETASLRSGFSENDLGSELGIIVNARKRVLIKDIVLNIAVCTYDSVYYRLNIYKVVNGLIETNILKEPVYIAFTREEAKDNFTYDLSSYSIIFEGEVLVALELYRDLGEGKLLFNTEYFTGTTFHRKTSQGNWIGSPGVIGISLNCLVR